MPPAPRDPSRMHAESLLTVERERRQRAEEEIPRLAEHWRKALEGAHAHTEAAEARAQRLAEALERIASRESVTMKGEGRDRVGVLRSYQEAVDIAREALASVPDREEE